MVLYEFCCSECGYCFEDYRDMEKRNEPAYCPVCKKVAERVFITGNIYYFNRPQDVSHITGKRGDTVSTRQDLDRVCKATGTIPMAPSELRNMKDKRNEKPKVDRKLLNEIIAKKMNKSR